MTAPALRCQDVTVLRRAPDGSQRNVLDGLDARFEPGRISVIAGPNGSGKTTLVHLLAGILRPDAGTVYAGDEPVSRHGAPHRDLFRRRVGLAMQSPRLIPGLTASENVAVPLVPRPGAWSRAEEQVSKTLASLSLTHLADSPVHALSTGERQRVALARALVSRSAYVLADEPTSSQDDDAVELVRTQLSAAAEAGSVVVVTTHDARLEAWGDERHLLSHGRLSG